MCVKGHYRCIANKYLPNIFKLIQKLLFILSAPISTILYNTVWTVRDKRTLKKNGPPIPEMARVTNDGNF